MLKKIDILQRTVFLLIIGCKFVFAIDSTNKIIDKNEIAFYELDDRKITKE